jgi:hypothetical protein
MSDGVQNMKASILKQAVANAFTLKVIASLALGLGLLTGCAGESGQQPDRVLPAQWDRPITGGVTNRLPPDTACRRPVSAPASLS